MTARLVEDVPRGWPVRVLVALEALSLLNNGSLTVRPDVIRLSGDTGNAEARDEIARLVTGKLGRGHEPGARHRLCRGARPRGRLPTPEQCVEPDQRGHRRAEDHLRPRDRARSRPTRSSRSTGSPRRCVECQTVQMEIGGHTDSQGSESMNDRLSQERADAVLNAIMARRVLTSNLSAKGYGARKPRSPTTAPRRAARRTAASSSASSFPTRQRRRTGMRRGGGQRMNRTEFIVAAALVLFVAFMFGWFAYWLLHRLTRVSAADIGEIEKMAQELHDAEEARDQAITYFQAARPNSPTSSSRPRPSCARRWRACAKRAEAEETAPLDRTEQASDLTGARAAPPPAPSSPAAERRLVLVLRRDPVRSPPASLPSSRTARGT
jgi:hypothetical protein